MKTKFLFALLCLITCFSSAQNLPKVVSGTIQRIENFQSNFVGSRNVDIWLPEGYCPNKKYAVLYMHDGQMLFDATTTWNHQSWDADDVATQLIKKTKSRILLSSESGI